CDLYRYFRRLSGALSSGETAASGYYTLSLHDALPILATAQQELIRLQGRYNENHPDVVALRREIAALSSGPINQANLAQQLRIRSEEHTSELQSRENLVCRLLLEKKKAEKFNKPVVSI